MSSSSFATVDNETTDTIHDPDPVQGAGLGFDLFISTHFKHFKKKLKPGHTNNVPFSYFFLLSRLKMRLKPCNTSLTLQEL